MSTTSPNVRRTTPLAVEREGVRLAGSLWEPDGLPRAVVLMHPGSGPSDRDNDVYFPPIREHLLQRGVAVCSFDKRGVGESTGTWLTAGIGDQAADASACLDHIGGRLPDLPLGLFGHSQGGWVVVEAAASRGDLSFVVANSGPGVTPAVQERHATIIGLAQRARDPQEFSEAVRCFDLALACISSGVEFEAGARIIRAAGLAECYERTDLFSFPIDDPDLWRFAALIVDHDPRPALRRLRAPTLAIFGADDPVVPVHASVAVYGACVLPELLTVEVLEPADHRLEHDSRLHAGYFTSLDQFIDHALR